MRWFKALSKGKKALVVVAAIAVVGGAVAGGVVLFKKRKTGKALPVHNESSNGEDPVKPAK